jgi:hypothetical protein
MDQAAMNELNEFLERYVTVWNEPETEQRRQLIRALWSEDAVHFTESLEARGYEAIEARVTRAYQEFVEPGEYIFKVANNADAHHDGAKLVHAHFA